MRTLVLLLLAACGGTAGSPENPCASPIAQQWGTASDDEALSLIAARDGGVYVGGYLSGTLGQSNLGPTGDSRAFVRRLSASGVLQWEAVLDTAQTDIAEALVEAPDGRVLAAGRTTGVFPGATQAGQFDAFAATLLPDGDVASVRQFGDERPQHPRRLALAGNRLLLAGFDDVFVPTNYVEDWENWAAVELSAADLGETWRQSARTAYPDQAAAIAIAPDGAVFVAGSNQGGAQPGIWVRKLDPQGQEIWGARYTTSPGDFSAAIAFASDGNLRIAGTRMGGGSQPVVFALDPGTGALRWTGSVPRDLNGSALSDMTVDAAGNIFVAGTTLTSVAPAFPNRGSSDPFVLRFDATGKLTGSWQGGSAAEDEATGVALDSCGRILVAGWTQGIVAGASSAGRRDAFLLSVQLQAE